MIPLTAKTNSRPSMEIQEATEAGPASQLAVFPSTRSVNASVRAVYVFVSMKMVC